MDKLYSSLFHVIKSSTVIFVCLSHLVSNIHDFKNDLIIFFLFLKIKTRFRDWLDQGRGRHSSHKGSIGIRGWESKGERFFFLLPKVILAGFSSRLLYSKEFFLRFLLAHFSLWFSLLPIRTSPKLLAR